MIKIGDKVRINDNIKSANLSEQMKVALLKESIFECVAIINHGIYIKTNIMGSDRGFIYHSEYDIIKPNYKRKVISRRIYG